MTAPSSIRTARPPGSSVNGSGKGATPTDDEPSGKKKTKKPKSKKKRIIIAVVALLVLGGVYHFVLAKKPAKIGPPKPGAVVSLTATTLNLTDGHFLKLQIALQTIAGTKGATMDTSNAADIEISEFTNLSMTDLTTDAERERIKGDLLVKLQKAYPGELMGVYFTNFVMQ